MKPASIVISSEDDEDTDEDSVDHRKVVADLNQRHPHLNVVPVNVPMPHVTPLRDNPACALCNLEFAGLDGLKTHMDRIHLRCSLCNLQFNVLAMALAHKKIHEDNAAAYKQTPETEDLLPLLSPEVLLDENLKIASSEEMETDTLGLD